MVQQRRGGAVGRPLFVNCLLPEGIHAGAERQCVSSPQLCRRCQLLSNGSCTSPGHSARSWSNKPPPLDRSTPCAAARPRHSIFYCRCANSSHRLCGGSDDADPQALRVRRHWLRARRIGQARKPQAPRQRALSRYRVRWPRSPDPSPGRRRRLDLLHLFSSTTQLLLSPHILAGSMVCAHDATRSRLPHPPNELDYVKS